MIEEKIVDDEKLETKEVKATLPRLELHPATEEFRKRQTEAMPKVEKVETPNGAMLLALEMMVAQLRIIEQTVASQAKLTELVIEKVKQGL